MQADIQKTTAVLIQALDHRKKNIKYPFDLSGLKLSRKAKKKGGRGEIGEIQVLAVLPMKLGYCTSAKPLITSQGLANFVTQAHLFEGKPLPLQPQALMSSQQIMASCQSGGRGRTAVVVSGVSGTQTLTLPT